MGLIEKIVNILGGGPEDSENATKNLGRNEPCWCGSGKKYKKCHLHTDEEKMRKSYAANCGKT